MNALRLLLASIVLALLAYTTPVIIHHGPNLLPVFFGDIARFGWPGQFNADFLSLLLLSGLWVAWRHAFSAAGLALGVLTFFGGGAVLSAYLLWASFAVGGDAVALLVGPARCAARRDLA
jgi:hypothetical protein